MLTILSMSSWCLLSWWLLVEVIISSSGFVLRPRRRIRTAAVYQYTTNVATTTMNRVVIPRPPPQVLVNLIVIDHYDSFTYNLVDMLTQLCGKPPAVFPSDCAETWTEFLGAGANGVVDDSYYDGIVLSPGPGHPRDCALGLDGVRCNPDVPILGVCLGHQIIGWAYNATVVRAPRPVHGQIETNITILTRTDRNDTHDRRERITLFEGIHNLSVTRYHSLQVILPNHDAAAAATTTASTAVEQTLRPTAIAREDNVLMALRHTDRPHWGVQFHPESIGTSHGMDLLANFVAECVKNKKKKSQHQHQHRSLDLHRPTTTMAAWLPPWQPQTNHVCPQTTSPIAVAPTSTIEPQPPQLTVPTTTTTTDDDAAVVTSTVVWIHQVPNLPFNGANMKPEHVMDELLASEPFTYWLDHADATRLPGTSILGSVATHGGQRVEYYGQDKNVTCLKVIDYADGVETTRISNETILAFLEGQIPESVKVLKVDFSGDRHWTSDVDATTLPFNFIGGFIGYLGYEVRLDLTKAKKKSAGPWTTTTTTTARSDDDNVPTASFVRADRSFVYCHETCQWYLVGTFQTDIGQDDVEEWMIRMSRRLQMGMIRHSAPLTKPKHQSRSIAPLFLPKRSPEAYADNFDRCLHHIRQGDSYELCLTNQLETVVDGQLDPLELHKILRAKNPAPYSAFMSWGGRFAICSSSPERFLSVKKSDGDLVVEAKPIKGTIARVVAKNGVKRIEREESLDRQRATDLQGSVKDRAENLMIVDLLRNDLSRVCRPGTVHVSKLMGIESYATVHQMVSTIRGSLNDDSLSSKKSASVNVLRACFPGGSMTGAPKVRSMEILNELEEGAARGPYSGCMGYLSLSGAMDMSILIRTAVLTNQNSKNDIRKWKVRIGAGGAITALSDRQSEFDELMLKADVVMRSVQEWAGGSTGEGFVAQAVQTGRLFVNSTETI